MAVDAKTVVQVAHLARLQIDEKSVSAYAVEMSKVLDLAGKMEAVDTTGIEPMAHPLHAVQRLRPDVVEETDQREKFQSVAPQVEDGHYLVPQVIE